MQNVDIIMLSDFLHSKNHKRRFHSITGDSYARMTVTLSRKGKLYFMLRYALLVDFSGRLRHVTMGKLNFYFALSRSRKYCEEQLSLVFAFTEKGRPILPENLFAVDT